MVSTTAHPQSAAAPTGNWLHQLNTVYHERALKIFMVIVLLHWGEHLFQAFQIWVLNWPRPAAKGMLGLAFPWLVSSETLHYGYALIMLIGLFLLLPGFTGRARHWWILALVIQFWHHIEHALLQGQVLFHHNLFGKLVPTSILQLAFPRVELHLFYNTIVFIPMIIAMYYHMYPPVSERSTPATCSCRRVETTS